MRSGATRGPAGPLLLAAFALALDFASAFALLGLSLIQQVELLMSTPEILPEIIGASDLTPSQLRSAVAACVFHKSPKGLVLNPQVSRLRRMRKTVITSSRLIESRLGVSSGRNARWKAAMLTLTYHRVEDWAPDHISALIRHARQFMRRRGYAFHYVWTAELQDRGAVHYHIVFWMPRISSGRYGFLKFPKPDDQGWWPWGSSRIHWARNAVGYLAKYASKASDLPDGHKYPKGCRLHAVGGLEVSERVVVRWWRAPVYARVALGPSADIRKVDGGYEDRFTGVFVKSPWVLVGFLGSFPFFVYKPIDKPGNPV